jgi:transposase
VAVSCPYPRPETKEGWRERVYERCCGLDVHKHPVVAYLVTRDTTGHAVKQVRSFRTVTAELLALGDWLSAAACTPVAMESTGVYWKPLYNALADAFVLLVVNAQHIKAVAGRKTDVRDAEWIADLLQHGVLHGSFIPPVAQRELRDLTRYRTTLVAERARTINRLQKTLEDPHLKLASVVTNILGKSARAAGCARGGRDQPPGLGEPRPRTAAREAGCVADGAGGLAQAPSSLPERRASHPH